jgi:O-antigen ligase
LGNQVEVPTRARLDYRDRARSAHNDVIATLLEVGVVGFILVAGFLVSLYRRFRLCKRVGLASRDPKLHLLVNAAFVQLMCILFFGLQAEPMTLPIKGFWLTAGIVVALSQTILERARAVEGQPTNHIGQLDPSPAV